MEIIYMMKDFRTSVKWAASHDAISISVNIFPKNVTTLRNSPCCLELL